MISENLKFNAAELNILVAALNSLSFQEEKRLIKDYGSVASVYNKIYSAWEEVR
jgi:hypothetical protein